MMSLIYKKEIIDGERSSRKVLGIPVYKRVDKNGVTTRKYMIGLWRTEIYPDKKRYYLFGRCVGEKKNEISTVEVDRLLNSYRALLDDYRKASEQLQTLLSVPASLKTIKKELHMCYIDNANLKNLIQCQELHKQTFGPYKNCMLGKTVVLVASGPTVKYHQPIEGAIYVGVNNACALESVSFDYLFCQDFYMDEAKRLNIAKYRGEACQKFFGRIPDRRMEHCRTTPGAQHVRRAPRYLVDMANAKEYYVCDYLMSNIAYDIELEPLHPGGIAFSAMQFILHCHPARVYIVGCDCSAGFFYQSDITFDNSWMIKIWREFKMHIDELYPDIQVISLNPVGLRGIFEDHYSEEYLKEVEI